VAGGQKLDEFVILHFSKTGQKNSRMSEQVEDEVQLLQTGRHHPLP